MLVLALLTVFQPRGEYMSVWLSCHWKDEAIQKRWATAGFIITDMLCEILYFNFFFLTASLRSELSFYFYNSKGEIVMLAIRVSNHDARLNTQHPKLSALLQSGFSQMKIIPPPRAKMGKHNSQWFDRNQMLGGPRTLVFAKWNSLFAWGFGGCYAGTFHITRTICSLVATRVHERLVKVNAACKLEHTV